MSQTCDTVCFVHVKKRWVSHICDTNMCSLDDHNADDAKGDGDGDGDGEIMANLMALVMAMVMVLVLALVFLVVTFVSPTMKTYTRDGRIHGLTQNPL